MHDGAPRGGAARKLGGRQQRLCFRHSVSGGQHVPVRVGVAGGQVRVSQRAEETCERNSGVFLRLKSSHQRIVMVVPVLCLFSISTGPGNGSVERHSIAVLETVSVLWRDPRQKRHAALPNQLHYTRSKSVQPQENSATPPPRPDTFMSAVCCSPLCPLPLPSTPAPYPFRLQRRKPANRRRGGVSSCPEGHTFGSWFPCCKCT